MAYLEPSSLHFQSIDGGSRPGAFGSVDDNKHGVSKFCSSSSLRLASSWRRCEVSYLTGFFFQNDSSSIRIVAG